MSLASSNNVPLRVAAESSIESAHGPLAPHLRDRTSWSRRGRLLPLHHSRSPEVYYCLSALRMTQCRPNADHGCSQDCCKDGSQCTSHWRAATTYLYTSLADRRREVSDNTMTSVLVCSRHTQWLCRGRCRRRIPSMRACKFASNE